MVIGRTAREDFARWQCARRADNQHHCPHVLEHKVFATRMVCCFCGDEWQEPEQKMLARHGTFLPAHEGGL